MVVGGSRQETLDPGSVLQGTRQQGVPVILRNPWRIRSRITQLHINQVKNEPIHHWRNQTVCPNSSIKNYNIASSGHGQLLSSTNENSLSINHNAELLLSKSTISNKNNNNNSHDNNYDANFVSIQNSLNNSIISPDESSSPRSIYQFITSSSSSAAAATHVTQTTPTVAKTITTDYKQYGCNTREINYKFNQLLGLLELTPTPSATYNKCSSEPFGKLLGN
ncbi:unnamed protein product [Schistosoma curassoni]|uniref:Serine/threonine-protein kinase DDB_G0282963 n=1 Tax=Schistosoma curassoni TaxID=6186 RepID=A0A183KFS6_9TREM|nr:unnamed protein product [Schistosoma curassoni]